MLEDKNFILETKRQTVHLLLGLVISAAVYTLTPFLENGLRYLILAPLIIALLLLYFIPKKSPDLKVANHIILHFERCHDAENCPFKGSIMYGLGIITPIIAALSFGMPLEVACAIIAVLSVGDSTSTWFGKFFGRIRIGKKSVMGFLAFVIFSVPAVLLYVCDLHLAIILAISGAILEFKAIIDDNLSIPIGLTLLYLILQNPIF